jgi:hypothetical protein
MPTLVPIQSSNGGRSRPPARGGPGSSLDAPATAFAAGLPGGLARHPFSRALVPGSAAYGPALQRRI